MVVRIRKRHPSILNRISIIALILAITALTTIFVYTNINSSKPVYNYVDIQIKYKRYTLVNKYRDHFDKYVFLLKNPVTEEETKVFVEYYLYDSVYFVGDTIR